MIDRIENTFEVLTNTATIAIFDPAALEHRRNDRDDWFAIARNQREEMSRGRLVLVPMEMDGRYRVRVTSGDLGDDEKKRLVSSYDSSWIQVTDNRVCCASPENLPGGHKPARLERDQTIHVPSARYRVALYAIEGENLPGPLPNLVVRLHRLPNDAEPPQPKNVPELWKRPKAARPGVRKKATAGAKDRVLVSGASVDCICDSLTATLALFDPQVMEARVADCEPDWPLDTQKLLSEARAGTLAFAHSRSLVSRPVLVRVALRPLAIDEAKDVLRSAPGGWVRVIGGDLYCLSSGDFPARGTKMRKSAKGIVRLPHGAYAVIMHALKPADTLPRYRIVAQLSPISAPEEAAAVTEVADLFR